MLTRGDEESVAKSSQYIALWTSIPTFIISLFIWINFNPNSPGFQMIERVPWMPSIGISYQMGIDGISIFFILLTTFLTPICIFATWKTLKHNVREYMIVMLVLETALIGSFCALDMLVFVCFFESSLIPIFLMIGIWEKGNKSYGVTKFGVCICLSSIPLLGAVLLMYSLKGTTDFIILKDVHLSSSIQTYFWVAFFIPFVTKMLMFPFHNWMLDKHVIGPIGTTVMLSCSVANLGGYGFLRLSFSLLPEATVFFAPFMMFLGVIFAIYGTAIVISFKSFKGLVLCLVFTQTGLILLGMFSLNEQGIQGAIIKILSQGAVTAGLVICLNILFERFKPGQEFQIRKLLNNTPRYLAINILLLLAVIGVPGTSGFIGNFLIVLGAFEHSLIVSVFVFIILILLIIDVLYIYQHIIFGNVVAFNKSSIEDLSHHELVVLLPITCLIFWIGVYPIPFLEVISLSAESITKSLILISGD
tara:strand:- start:66 stop:1490 length:1425 start_codon:yes stop_codon:yes gene_type:complete